MTTRDSEESSSTRSWAEAYGSDLALKVLAPGREAAFAEAAIAFGRILAEGERREITSRSFELEARDPEALLVALLEEVLYLFDTKQLLPVALRIERLGETELAGRLLCDRFDPKRHQAGHGVKAVTWHELSLRETEDGLALSVVLDL